MEWGKLLAAMAVAAMIFLMYQSIKNKPELFSKINLSKSFYTTGILALLLILFIGACVMLLNQGG